MDRGVGGGGVHPDDGPKRSPPLTPGGGGALKASWGLPVLCVTDTNAVRTTACMTPSVTAMGITVHIHPPLPPLALR